MDGMEKITARIQEDADREIAAMNARTDEQIAALQAQAQAQADKERGEILARGERAAAERLERLKSAAQMERRKLELAARQEVLSEAFDQALERLCTLPDEEYIELLAALAVKAARTGREKVIFSQKDRNRVGKAVVTRANDALARKVAPRLPGDLTDTKAGAILDKVVTGASAILAGTGMLTLAEETRPIKGGIILSDGDVETNCTFETLVRLQRENISGEVAKVLFD